MSIVLDAPSTTDAARELRADLVERAAKLRPMLADNAEAADREGAVPPENVEALAGAGLLTLMQPARYGGLQTDFRTLLEVVGEVGKACGSSAWITSLLNASGWFVGLFPAQAQDDVWAEHPEALVAGSVTPGGEAQVVEGGYRLSGRWMPASGCAHAQWAILGVLRPDAEGTADAVGVVLVPTSQMTIEETWSVTGMRGTASNTLVGEDLFVPAHRFISVPDAIEGRYPTPFTDEALYRAPFVPVAALALVGPSLGLAAAAVDLLVERAPRRPMMLTSYTTMAEAPTVQLAVANAAASRDSALLHAYRAAADMDETARAGGYPDYAARARIRMDTGTAVVRAREAVTSVVSAQGASAFSQANVLQRVWRDIEAGSRHGVLNPEVAVEIYGQSLLGIRGAITDLV